MARKKLRVTLNTVDVEVLAIWGDVLRRAQEALRRSDRKFILSVLRLSDL